MSPARLSAITLLLLGVATPGACRRDSGPEAAAAPVENLRAFARLYGYLRYFHPSDEAAAVDWDRLAIHGAGRVKGARTAADLHQALDELFAPVAPTLRIFPSGERAPAIALPPATAETQPVAWQHVGYGLGSMPSVYRSGRTNRPREIRAAGHGFGTATRSVPAEAHRGKGIRLSARVRAEVDGTGNQAQLWLRVDRAKQAMGFFDNMDDRPIRTPTWQRVEVEGKVDADAVAIAFGGFLAGSGKAWFDDFRLEVENAPGKWTALPLENAGFEADAEDARPWRTSSPGYRYRVVGDGAKEGKRALLIEPERGNSSEALFSGGPALGEMVEKPLGRGLSCRFPLVLPSVAGKTWGPVRRPLEPLQRALAAVGASKLDARDERLRLANVILTWNVFQHFYPYFDVVRVDWDATLTRALERALADPTHAGFTRTLRWLVAQAQDGHGHVRDPGAGTRGWLPWRLEWIDDQVVVTAARPDSGLRPGDVLATVDGKPAGAQARALEEYVSGSPQWRRQIALHELSEGPAGSHVELTVRRGADTHHLKLAREMNPDLPQQGRSSPAELPGGIWYVDLDRTPWEEIAPLLPKLAAAPGVVFDLRGYPKGNHAIIQHLLREDDRSAGWMQVPRIARPDRERIVGWERHGWEMPRQEPRLRGRVAFITGPRAISYAESFMSFIEHYRLAEIVGQPTAGTNGNVNPFDLPGGFQVVFTGMKVLKHDGSQLHHIGIRPTVPVQRTLEGVRQGRDEPFEAALRLVSGKS